MRFPKRITVAAVPYKQLFEFPSEPGHSPGGIEGMLLDTLARTLKFEYSLMTPADGEWGNFRNGNWTGTIETLRREEADIALASLSVELRLLGADDSHRVIDFSVPYMDTEMTFATSLPKSLPRAYAYIYPFDASTWMVLFALLMGIPPLMHVLRGNSYSLVLLETFGNFLGKSAARDAYRKGWVAFWLLAVMVVSQSYVSLLPSFMFAPLREKPMTTFKQLREGISKGEYRACVYKGSGELADMLLSESEDIVIVGREIERRRWFYEDGACSSNRNVTQRMAYINDRTYLELEYGQPPYSNMVFGTEGISTFPYFVIGVSKTFCCKKRIDKIVRRIFEGGLMQPIVKEVIRKTRGNMFNDSEERSIRMKVDDIKGLLFILLVGHTVSTFVLMVELFYGKCFFKT